MLKFEYFFAMKNATDTQLIAYNLNKYSDKSLYKTQI